MQPCSRLFLIQQLKMLAQFLSKIPRLVMIGNSCLKPFHAAVMHALVASTQPLDSPSTALNVSSPTCTWVEFKLSIRALSPFTFTFLASKCTFFLQCSINSVPFLFFSASFMNLEFCRAGNILSLHQLLWNTHHRAI